MIFAHIIKYIYCMQGNFDIKNLTNLNLPRFDQLRVDETLDFISTSKIYYGKTGLTWLLHV